MQKVAATCMALEEPQGLSLGNGRFPHHSFLLYEGEMEVNILLQAEFLISLVQKEVIFTQEPNLISDLDLVHVDPI